ncbi:MAG: hypothetical protein ACOY93_07270 [Bacillota bacterium]
MTQYYVLVIPLLAAIYTWNYGRWAWRQKLRLGGVGLYLLALLTVAVPLMVLLYNE